MKLNKKINTILILAMILILITGCDTKKEDIDNNIKIDSELDKEEVGDKETGEDSNIDEDTDTSKEQDDNDVTDGQASEGDKETGEDNKGDRTLAEDFTLSDGKGNEYSVSDFKGKLLLVNFFTTWCVYCEKEMPDFQKVYDKYKDEDVAILAVDVQHDAKEKPIEEVLEWVEERNLTFPVVFDEDKTATSKYYISGYPTTYVIDKEGYVIGYVNAMNEEMLEKLIEMYR